MIKKSLIALVIFALPLTSSAYTFSFLNFSSGDQSKLNLGAALPVLTAPQGGTGVGSATAGQIGSCLTIASASPFTWSIGSCGGSSGSWATTSEQYFWSQFRDLSVQGNGYLAPTTTLGLIVLASSTIDKFTATISTTTSATTTNLAILSLNQQIPYANAQGSILGLGIGTGLSLTGGTLSAATGWATTSQDYYSSQFRDWSVQGNGYLAPTTTRGIIVNNNSSSTIANLQIINGTTTNATSTKLFATTASTTNLFSSSVLIATTSQSQSSVLSATGNGFFSGSIYASNFYDTSLSGNACIGESAGLLGQATNCVSAITSSGSTLTVSSPTGNVNIDLNLAHANTWSVLQTFTGGILGNNSTSTITNLTMVTSTSTYATSTSIYASAGLSIASTTPTQAFSVHGKAFISGDVFLGATTTATTSEGYTGRISPMRYLTLGTGTTTTWTSTTSGAYIPRTVAPFTGTIRNARCTLDAGFLNVDFYHTSTHLTLLLGASTTVGTVTFTSNNTFNVGEPIYASFGTTTTSTTLAASCILGVTETP